MVEKAWNQGREVVGHIEYHQKAEEMYADT